jgi:hypothetical protein
LSVYDRDQFKVTGLRAYSVFLGLWSIFQSRVSTTVDNFLSRTLSKFLRGSKGVPRWFQGGTVFSKFFKPRQSPRSLYVTPELRDVPDFSNGFCRIPVYLDKVFEFTAETVPVYLYQGSINSLSGGPPTLTAEYRPAEYDHVRVPRASWSAFSHDGAILHGERDASSAWDVLSTRITPPPCEPRIAIPYIVATRASDVHGNIEADSDSGATEGVSRDTATEAAVSLVSASALAPNPTTVQQALPRPDTQVSKFIPLGKGSDSGRSDSAMSLDRETISSQPLSKVDEHDLKYGAPHWRGEETQPRQGPGNGVPRLRDAITGGDAGGTLLGTNLRKPLEGERQSPETVNPGSNP